MTLNEKFDRATDGWIVADKCEEIADEHAIEFAKWIINNRVEFFDDISSGEIYTYRQYHSKYSMIELLKIFKQEIENL
jgi:hypothetical protein